MNNIGIAGGMASGRRKLRFWGMVCLAVWLLDTATGQIFAQQVTNSLRNPQDQTQSSEAASPGTEVQKPDDQPAVSTSDVEAVRQQAAASTELDAETKQKIESITTSSLEGLKRIEELARRSEQYRQEAGNVAQRVGALRQKLGQLQETEPAPPDIQELAELEQEVTQRGVELSNLKMQLAQAEAAPVERVNRRREIRNLLLTAGQRLKDIEKQLESKPAADEPPLLTTAKRQSLQISQQGILVEQAALQNEQVKYEYEDATDFLRLQRDILARQVRLAETELQQLQKQLGQRRAADSAKELRTAKEVVQDTPELIRDYAEDNVKLAEEANTVTGPLQQATKKLQASRDQLEKIQKEFTTIEERVEEIGLTGSVGAMLRRQRAELPDLRQLRTDLQNRKALIEDVQYKIFDYDDQRSHSQEQELEIVLTEVPSGQRENLKDWALELIEDRRGYLDTLLRNYKSYLDTLFELDATEQLLIRETNKFQNYIDERVLWIRSSRPLYTDFRIDSSDLLILDGQQWWTILRKIVDDLRTYPLIYVPTVILFLLLLYRRRRFRQELKEQGQIARRGSCIQYWPTLRAGWLTLLVSIAWPGLIIIVAWRLTSIVNGDLFSRAFARSLVAIAWTLLPLEILRQIFRADGLADAHFDWPPKMIAIVRRNLRWFLPVAIISGFFTSFLYHCNSEQSADAVDRISFILGLVFLGIFANRVLNPKTGIAREYQAYYPDSWLGRLKSVWYWSALIVVLVLIGMTVAGYFYTAQRLTGEIYFTLMFLILIQVVRGFLQRLVNVRRRKIQIEKARERRAAEIARRQEAGEGTTMTSTADYMPPPEDYHLEIDANTEQTRRLIQTGFLVASIIGLWLIWVDVLPALRMLDRWPLWTTKVTAASTVSLPAPSLPGMGSASATATPEAPEPAVTERLEAVTIADLAFALLIGIATFACARNVPGLMEISILQRLPFDNSIRYAITTVTSYVIVLLGLILAFNAISIGWTQVQWLATALTFGLAFGLQEIFANFVAGLILLFERPMRVGDIVTVDDITGVVSRIRIRATTITNWDRKEYVVPNKEFITGRMLNWTLSDKINRVTINVGIAYGSNVDRAKKLLRKTCEENPLVLKDPAPLITFEGFGDNSLNLVLRLFLPDLDSRLDVIDEMHTRIDKAFRRAGIEIAFPQRDLHLRSVDPAVLENLRQPTRNSSSKLEPPPRESDGARRKED